MTFTDTCLNYLGGFLFSLFLGGFPFFTFGFSYFWWLFWKVYCDMGLEGLHLA